MANIKSQKKRIKTNEKGRVRNLAVRSELKTLARKFREALAAGDRDVANAALERACRAYDRAVAKGVVHKNNAANHKSRLRKAFNKTAA
jgi:small subunit ribosomal protein S20